MNLLVQEGDLSVSEFQFLGAPPLWVTVLVILPAMMLLVGFVYRREASSATNRAKTVLACLRLAALVLVLLILFQPVNRSQVFSVTKSIVAFVLDESASMDRVEEYDDDLSAKLAAAAGLAEGQDPAEVPRTDLVKGVLAHGPDATMTRIEEKVDVELYGFSATTRPLTDVGELVANGEATAAGDALLSVLNELRHRNLAGIVLVSDGQSNRGREMMEVARLAASEGVPIHTVGVGNPAQPRNVAVLEVTAPDVVLVNDEVAVEVTLLSQGYGGEPAEVVIRERLRGEELASSSFTLASGGQQTETVYFKPSREGEYDLEIAIPVKPGEQFPDDNQKVHHLRVEPEVIKVLYVEGRPRWEYRFLKALLLRAENVRFQMLAVWASTDVVQDSTEGVPALTRFPPTRQDLFEYDVVILGDVAPDEIDIYNSRGSTSDLLADLREFVEVGGGLVMVAGQLDSPRNYRDTPIADVLPVEIGNPEEVETEKQDLRPFRPHIPDPLQPHNIVRLEKDPALNLRLIEDAEEGLPPMRWYGAVRRAKPGADVILQHPFNSNRYGPHVLVAATQYAAGRTCYVGFDETWLWRKPYEDRYTERFWRAAIRHVAIGKLRRADKRYDLRTDKEKYNLGELMQLSVRVLDEDFRPSSVENQLVQMQRGEAAPEDLLTYRQDQGTYERTVRADLPGTYRFWIEDPGQADRRLSQRTVEVEVPRLEILNPSLDQIRLKSVADVSEGLSLGLHELDRLVDELKGDSRRIPVRTEQTDLWDRWEALALLMLFLGVEWAVRKRFNLL